MVLFVGLGQGPDGISLHLHASAESRQDNCAMACLKRLVAPQSPGIAQRTKSVLTKANGTHVVTVKKYDTSHF